MLAWRGLSVVIALSFATFGVVAIVWIIESFGHPTCADATPFEDCYDGTSTQHTATSVIGIPAGLFSVATLVASIFFAATGRKHALMMILGAITIALYVGVYVAGRS